MRRLRARSFVLVVIGAGAAFASTFGAGGALSGCSSSKAPTGSGESVAELNCPSDLPATCPAAEPSFAKDVQPVFVKLCDGCHTGSGVAVNAHDFSTYDGIFSDRSVVLDRFYACAMPPSDAGQPTAEERAALLGWLVCKAPNN